MSSGEYDPGEFVASVDDDGRLLILHAPRHARLTMELLTADSTQNMEFLGDCVVLGGLVWYRPVGFADGGHSLICKLVRDDRQVPRDPTAA